MNTLSQQVGARLRAARKAAKFRTAREFAKHIDVPESTYSQHETGVRSLNVDSLLEYSQLLQLNSGWLLTGQGPPYSKNNPQAEAIIQRELQLSDAEYAAFNAKLIKEDICIVEIPLLKEILLTLIPLFANSSTRFNPPDLVNFCFDLYNRVVSQSSDTETRLAMIQVAVSSLR